MIAFPDHFDKKTKQLKVDDVDNITAVALSLLNGRGYEVHLGLTPELADQISLMAMQPSIREYCPKDISERFTDRATTESWLSKGRLAVLLIKSSNEGQQLVGYGWVGSSTSPRVPGGETTFALRIGEANQGQGLATPFSQVIIGAATSIYEAKNLWLETWESDAAAVHIYKKLGFETVDQVADERPSLSGNTVQDNRLYMTKP